MEASLAPFNSFQKGTIPMKRKSLLRMSPAGYTFPTLLLFASLSIFAVPGLAQTTLSENSLNALKETPEVTVAAETTLEVSKSRVEEKVVEIGLTGAVTKFEKPTDNLAAAGTPQPWKPKTFKAAADEAGQPSEPASLQNTSGSEPGSKFAVFFYAGVNIPHEEASDFLDPSLSLSGGVEYSVTEQFSLEGILGFHRFRFGGIFDDHANLYQVSANAKYYFGNDPARLFVNAGGGVYNFDGSSTRGGLNVGGGVQLDISPKFAVEGAYNLHNVFTSGSNFRFSTVQGGVRFRF